MHGCLGLAFFATWVSMTDECSRVSNPARPGPPGLSGVEGTGGTMVTPFRPRIDDHPVEGNVRT